MSDVYRGLAMDVASGAPRRGAKRQTSAIPVPPAIVGLGYTLNFHDEFEGSTYDDTVWNPKEFWESEPPVGAIEVSGSTLKVRNYGPWPGASTITDQSLSTGPYWGLDTAKRSWMFGYFECRMRFSSGQGSWPAFWMISRYQAEWPGYPSCTGKPLNFELDIMEYQGDEPNTFYGTIHRNTGDVCGTADTTRGVVTTPGGDLSGSTYHTYAAKWTASTVEWYVDEVSQGAVTNFDSGSQEMVLSLTMQSNGWDDSNLCIASTPDPLVSEFDWVRVWQQ